MQVLEGLRYTKDHEWVKESAGVVLIGITDYAQLGLGDVVYVELPETGAVLNRGDAFGVVESVKAASDVYTPISGEVLEVNGDVLDTPELLNQAPYDQWMLKIKPSNPSEMEALMDAATYREWCNQEG